MADVRIPDITRLSDRFYLSVEATSDPNKKKVSFFYNGLEASNQDNLMLVLFHPDADVPMEVPMIYDSHTNQYKASIETPDVCEKFFITKAKIVGDKANPDAEVLQQGFLALNAGILQPVNQMPDVPAGELKIFLLTKDGRLQQSEIRDITTLAEGDRFVSIYFPPDYDPNRVPPYKLQVTLDGGQYLNPMQMNVVMDNLIAAKEIEPVVTLFISPHSGPPKKELKGFGIVMPEGYSLAMRLREYCCNPEFADLLATVPNTMAQQLNVSTNRDDITIWGVSAGGLQAVYAALLHPNVFGNVVAESPMSWNIPEQNGADWREGIIDKWNERIEDITWTTATAILPETEGEHHEHITQMMQMSNDSVSDRELDTSMPIRFYLDAGSRERHYIPSEGSANLLTGAELFAEAAMAKGHTVVDDCVHVIPDGGHHNMTWMRNQVAIIRSMHEVPKLTVTYSEVETAEKKSSTAFVLSQLPRSPAVLESATEKAPVIPSQLDVIEVQEDKSVPKSTHHESPKPFTK